MYMSMHTAMFGYLVISMLLDFLGRDIVFLVKLNDTHMESYEVSLNDANKRGEQQGGKFPFSLLSEPISPSSLPFESISPSSLNVYLTAPSSIHTWISNRR